MALKKCKECDNQVSSNAESCPKCGAVLKKKTSCLGMLGAGILILFFLGVIGSFMDDTPSSKKQNHLQLVKLLALKKRALRLISLEKLFILVIHHTLFGILGGLTV